jgi:hypothetical protein
MEAVKGYYAARIAAARQSFTGAKLTMAIRAIQNEKALAVRAVIERWQAHFQNRKQKAVADRPGGEKTLLRYKGYRNC